MLIEFGNSAAHNPIDGSPCVTSLHVPEADETGAGGYTHTPGKIDVDTFRQHRAEALDFRGGITSLPDHEILLAATNVWPTQSKGRPDWVKVTAHDLTPKKVAADIEAFLREFYGCDTDAPEFPEETHWTRLGPPGSGLTPPPITNLFTNNGRVIANVNDGGGKVGLSGTGTAATATTFTTASTLVTNEWAGYRVYAMQASAGPIIWGNVLSNTNAAASSVLTVDRWYNAATPGGAAATTPSSGFYFILADGGATSAWFVGLATGANAVAATDVSLSTNGNVEYVTGGAGRGYVRKIAPYAQTSGVASRSITLTPVFTGDGSDAYPTTFTTIGVFVGMVVGSAGTMKFETALNASATVGASGDQLTVTETITGS